MKGSIIVIAIISFITLTTLASENSVIAKEYSTNEISDSPQVCQFSLSNYSGTIDSNGDTNYFKVGLSCPQSEDVRATVVVFINNEHAASKVVTIRAGHDYSESVFIHVDKEFKGERYKLVVQ